MVLVQLFLLLAVQSGAVAPSPPEPIGMGEWIGSEDYPVAAAREQIEGTVGFDLTVDEGGRVTECRITRSAGPILDVATCRILGERARFRPGRNAAGAVVPSSFASQISWRLPGAAEPIPVPFAPSQVAVITYLSGGSQDYCRVETRGTVLAMMRSTVCAPGTSAATPPRLHEGVMFSVTSLIPDGQKPDFRLSRGGVLDRTRIRFEVDAGGVVTRCDMIGSDPGGSATRRDYCTELRAGGRPIFLPAEAGSPPRTGELRISFGIDRTRN